MSALAAIFSASMLAQTLGASVPYICAAQGGVVSERSGVVNIALEGTLLSGALAAVAVAHATGSALLGVLGGAVAGGAIGMLHALLVVKGRIDAIVSGIALNLAAAGGTRVVLRALYDSSSNSPSIEGFRFGATGAGGGAMLVRAVASPLFIASVAASIAVMFVLARTRFGLRLRACGESPFAAASAGVDVDRTRVAAVCLGGALAGLGGAALSFEQHQFQSGMSGGRGFIALAAVIVAGWRPGRAALACVAFAALDALEGSLQGESRALHDVVAMLPYAATLFALAALSLRKGAWVAAPPAGLGRHPD